MVECAKTSTPRQFLNEGVMKDGDVAKWWAVHF